VATAGLVFDRSVTRSNPPRPVTAVQRTSSDLRLNPHLHVVFLDGAYHEQGPELTWTQHGHLGSRHVGLVLDRAGAGGGVQG
jgi:hypothetical protein